jgi:single-stranded DNA-binding protein
VIDGLIAGKVFRQFTERVSKNNNTFCTGKIRVAVRDGDAIFVNVIAFNSAAVTALMALSDGDSVALTGELTPKVYVPAEGAPRPSLDLLAHAVLSPFQVQRKRAAAKPTLRATPAGEVSSVGAERDFDDAIPF